MALGIVQAGYRNSLYMYSAGFRSDSELSYAELLAELTTELELALEGSNEGLTTNHDDGTDTGEDSEQIKEKSDLKKEWEELLEQSEVVEAMLRQMLENGLGQRDEAQKENSKKKSKETMDNEFDMSGVPMDEEGKHRAASEYTDFPGNSEFLQENSGAGSEYWNSSNAGRKRTAHAHIMCLTCKTECDRKKQWKIAE